MIIAISANAIISKDLVRGWEELDYPDYSILKIR